MKDIFETPITFLKGVGPKKAIVLEKEAGIETFEDLLNYYPFRYVDKSKIYKVSDVTTDTTYFQLRGKISNLRTSGEKRMTHITATFSDETGEIGLAWFRGLRWIKDRFQPGKTYTIFGKPSVFKNRFNFVHPEVEDFMIGEEQPLGQRFEGIYRSTEKMKNSGLGSRGISKIVKQLINQTGQNISENIPGYIISNQHLVGRKEALLNIHFPQSPNIIEKAINRLKFEELFFLQLQILTNKQITLTKSRGQVFQKVGHFLNKFYDKNLPFELTNAQKKVIREIRSDFAAGKQMNRLLQGDVGSGKTIVALMCMLIALDNGFQVSLMAPTEILANQHYKSVKKLLQGMDVTVALLTGSTKKAERKIIHESLLTGSLQILIGTHALIEENVIYKNLGFVVIDEQHRFGVAQRAKLWQKNHIPPHVLVMTATPIPRTLAMTVYGNLDVSVIDELPPGRKAIKTAHYFESKRLRVTGFMREQIKAGKQIYVVYPLISESEKLDLKNLMDGFAHMQQDFPAPDYLVSVLHGRMKPEDKDYEMQRFVEGKTDIMVSTTVIEVGVDVPNASVMIIENAERFGLSQLHQLRGRVGRGADQSYCILMSGNKVSHEGRKRLETMVRTNDGFEIAEADLQLRGPGDIEGTRQSGLLDFKIANLAQDNELIALTRKLAENILVKDPDLDAAENKLLKLQLHKLRKGKVEWGKIS